MKRALPLRPGFAIKNTPVVARDRDQLHVEYRDPVLRRNIPRRNLSK